MNEFDEFGQIGRAMYDSFEPVREILRQHPEWEAPIMEFFVKALNHESQQLWIGPSPRPNY